MQRRRPNSISTPQVYYVGADPKALKISGSGIADEPQSNEIIIKEQQKKKRSPDKLHIVKQKKVA